VHGSKGSLRIYHYANLLYLRDAKGMRQIAVQGSPAPAHFGAQMRAFTDAIKEGRPTPVAGEEGLAACRALLGVYAGNGVPV
jgi:predicted dehydrogenase